MQQNRMLPIQHGQKSVQCNQNDWKMDIHQNCCFNGVDHARSHHNVVQSVALLQTNTFIVNII